MKLTIAYQSGSRRGTEKTFSDKESVTFGRHEDNDCVFADPSDRVVSGFHAEIQVVEGCVYVLDKGSTNGVLVNGKWVEEYQLASGDTVELGKDGPSFRVEYSLESKDSRPAIVDDPVEAKTKSIRPRPSPATRDIPGSLTPSSNQRFLSYPISRMSTPYTYSEPPPKPPGQDGEKKKYGERTVGMMIQKALIQAGLMRPQGTTKSTDYFEALVENRVKSTWSRLRIIIAIAVSLLVVGGSGFGYYIYRNRSVNVYQTTQINYGDAAGGSIAATNRFAVFMLAGQAIVPGGRLGETKGFCTAFAVATDVLATNAHCVLLAQKEFANAVAIMNGMPSGHYPIVRIVAHPSYVPGTLSPDVGLILIQGRLTDLVAIAAPEELGQVAPGVPMFLYGFPGRLNREDAPEATFVKGDIGRITNFDQKLGNFGDNTLLQHSAFSSAGTSGSPIFNTAGHVIGINAGGYAEDGKALAGYNFAMRIDLINTLLPVIKAK
jgi:pSer/pThr/pTyr-binding forkhead associated (FHA) protein